MAGRRNHKRYIKRLEVEFTVDGVIYRGISSDFSLKGLFIRTTYPVVPDTVLNVTIHLPDGSVSNIRVKVVRAWRTAVGRVMGSPVRTAKNGMGVEVVERDANYLHFIRSLLN